MGKGCGSIPQAQASVVVAIDLNYVYFGLSSKEPRKEANMKNQLPTINKTVVCRISIMARIKRNASCLIMAALLMFGRDGLSPSAIAHLNS